MLQSVPQHARIAARRAPPMTPPLRSTSRAVVGLWLVGWWLLSAVDGRWGQLYSLRLFALPAVLQVARQTSLLFGVLAAAAASGLWFCASHLSHPDVPFRAASWEAATRFGTAVFLVLVVRWMEARESQQRTLAERDELSGLLNRRGFLSLAPQRLSSPSAAPLRYAVLMLDLDEFKSVNDRYGHAAGDRILKDVALAIQGSIRQSDLAARWGGDEFVILLPSAEEAAARAVASRIRHRLETSPSSSGEGIPRVSVSLGVACDATGSLHEQIELADKRLLEAKAARANLAT